MSTLKLFARKTAATLLDKSGVLRLRTAWGERFRVLMYHRVIDPETVPYPLEPGMYVRPETFRMHMGVLARDANLLPLDELVSMISQRRRIPRRSVAVTFDDGWYDNLAYAVPILREYRIPATIFLATSFIGSSAMFWTDTAAIALRACLLAGGVHTRLDERALRNSLSSAESTDVMSTLSALHGLK
ncbi:MAG: polysaccharide deacetylase family protein [Deltaproteobacteria bacterium]|nr:polysaccharide deacetylase family protein [Deltaproteobacteria bacterium]